MSKKLKVYTIRYASGIFRNNNRQEVNIYSEIELKKDEFIVVEHIDCGLFIGQVLMDVSEIDYEDYTDDEIKEEIEYRYIQPINLVGYFSEIDKKKRKEELKQKMEEKFKEIDKEQKYAYYSELNDEFKELYSEYKSL